MPNVGALKRGWGEFRNAGEQRRFARRFHRSLKGVAYTLPLAWVLVSAAPHEANAVEVVTPFDSVNLVENPDNWTITGLPNTIDGGVAGPVFGRIFTNQQDATGVVIDYAFTVPKEQVTRLQLFNNGGGILDDFDGIGTALVEVFDPSNNVLFSGTLNAGNGGSPFDTVFPSPLDDVSRVRLSSITNLPGHSAPDIIWRELWTIQDLEPAIDIEKSGSVPDPPSAGDTIDYTFVVTNTGNATLTNVTVMDPLPDLSPIECPGDSLAPGAEMTCTASYVVTQGDVKTGLVENTATVTGDPPGGLPQVTDEDSATVPLTQTPGIAIDKSGSGPDPLEVGATVDYTFVVTNTGNVTLSSVAVTDPLPGLSPIACPDDTLAPGAETTCTASYTVTQDDVDVGVIENTATVTGQPPQGPQVTDEDSAMVPPQQTPGINIEKSGSGPDPLTVGATVDYSFVVTNTGNVTLSNITVTDPLPGLSPISCPGGTLAPGQDMTCTATYTVTQDDADEGFVENTATVTGNPPSGPPESDEDGAVVPPSQKPGISLEKSGSGPDPLTVGATIDYTFLVTNIGNVTLSSITVTDPLPGLSPISCPSGTLAPGAEMTCAATYTVTQQDVDTGTVENTAAVTGQPPGALPPVEDEDSAAFPPDQDVGISIEKSGSGPDPLTVGATVEYTFLVTNTGNVTLSNITITDRLPGLSPVSCPGTTLAPGAEMTCTATYTVTQANVDAGVVVNTATVTGHPPTGGPPATDESTTTVPPTEPVPALPPLALGLLLALLSALAMGLLRRARA